jgi:hypothetical protein
MNFEFGYEQHVQDAESVIITVHDDGATGRRARDEVAVLDEKSAAIAEVDGEWTKRHRVEHVL